MRRFFFGLAVFALVAPLPLLAETTDRQIAQQIVKQLKSQKESGSLKGFNLDLQVEDGAVYLKGFVSEREQRRKAVEVARQVEGVKQVFNEIEIKNPETARKTDSVRRALASKRPEAKQLEVKLASTPLPAAPAPPQVDIEASHEDSLPAASEGESQGILEVVKELPQPLAAQPEASATSPASKIPTNVFRNPQPISGAKQHPETRQIAHIPSAREITQKIVGQYRQAMSRGELQGFGIKVKVDKGEVLLDGTVSDSAQLEYAIEVARNVRGVTKVINGLKVAGQAEATPASHDGSDEGVQHAFRQESSVPAIDENAERIAKAVVDGLQREKQQGSLANFGIDVQVDGRIVWMSGYVKNSEQHARALNVARYVPGVEKVVNDLKVQSQGTPLRPVNATLPQAMTAQPAAGQQMLNYQMVPVQYVPVQAMQAMNQTPMAFAPARPVNHTMMQPGQPVPMTGNAGVGIAPARFDHPQMPGYAWPSYAPSPNYGAVTYPKQYSPSAWPYIGPFYPYPQVPLGWRRVTLEWDDGWWNLKFKNTRMH